MEKTNDNKTQNKKSFILYLDTADIFEQLTDEEAGKLIKGVLFYVHTGNDPVLDRLLQMAFTPIKQSLHRDLEKWRIERDSRAEAGRIGGLKTQEKHRQANQASACFDKASLSTVKQAQANQAVNVSVNDNVINKKEIKEKKTKLKKQHEILDLTFISEIFLPLVKEWIDYKIMQWNFTYSQIGIQKWYKCLHRETEGRVSEAQKLIDEAIARNWQGYVVNKGNYNANSR